MYILTDFQLVTRHKKCDGDKGWIVKNGWNSMTEKWVEEKFHRHHGVEACARRCNGVASMFRITTCKDDLCGCICEVGASHEGTCSQVPQNYQRLFRYISKGMYFCTIFNSNESYLKC